MIALTLATLLAGAPAARAAEPSAGLLSVQRAIALAVERNLRARLARADTAAARARALEYAGALLPSVLGYVSQSRVMRDNLAARGFPASSALFNPLIGPYNVFDARLQLTQDLLDLAAIDRARASRAGARAAALEERLAGEQVAAAAALAYLELLRARRGVETAQADLDLAKRLEALADDQKRAGSATGLDVARARTRAAGQRLRLLEAQVARRDAELRLKRLAGLPLGEAVDPADPLKPATLELPAADAAIAQALERRAEAALARETAEQARLSAAAAGAERLPALTATADAGLLGNQPDRGARLTGSFGARLSVPLFEGGRLAARQEQARQGEAREQERLGDALAQIEEDVRLSLQQAQAAAERQTVAAEGRALAARELSLAQDRFTAGAGDNVELTTAQDQLARAESDETAALVDANAARVNLAMALGRMSEFKY